MATTRIINVQDLDPVLRRIDNFNGQLSEQFKGAMWASVMDLENEIVPRTPIGTGYAKTGNLQSSIFSDVRGTPTGLHGIVATPAVYGVCVEEGTKPHWPPESALWDWVRLILGVPEKRVMGVAYLIAWKIFHHGTKGKKMFEKGYQASEPRIKQQFLAAFKRVASIIGGGS